MGHVNEADLDWTESHHGDTAFRRKQLGAAADGDAIGASLYELEPDHRAWPYHYHTANEEAMYVLEGAGTVRVDDEPTPIEAGDYLAFPPGPDSAHVVVNDGDDPLRYLMVSTMTDPDVTVYPDSEKFGVFVGSPPGGREDRSLHGFYRIDDDVDFWTGEE
ncbi:MAG: cupin domain-containing protein [Halobacteriaceae archaeon]